MDFELLVKQELEALDEINSVELDLNESRFSSILSKIGIVGGVIMSLAPAFGAALSGNILAPVILVAGGAIGGAVGYGVGTGVSSMAATLKKVIRLKNVKPNYMRFEQAMVERDRILVDIAILPDDEQASAVKRQRNQIKKLTNDMKRYASELKKTIEDQGGIEALPLSESEKKEFEAYLDRAKDAALSGLNARMTL